MEDISYKECWPNFFFPGEKAEGRPEKFIKFEWFTLIWEILPEEHSTGMPGKNLKTRMKKFETK